MSVEVNHMTMPKEVKKDAHVNYDAMFREAIEAIGEMAGENWTNYNPSDPGVTILEYLCYGLLDLGYKSSFPMKDLLTDKEEEVKTRNRFYTSRQILFSNPLTSKDFRKVLVDRVEEIKNVWLEKSNTQHGFSGTYEVFFELSDSLKTEFLSVYNESLPGPKQQLREEFQEQLLVIINGINAILHQHRNLGTIFYRPTLLAPLKAEVQGSFYLSKEADVEKTIAKIFFTLNNYSSRFIHFKTYGQLKKDGLSVGDIMEGPRLSNGFINDSDLQPRKSVIDTTTLKSQLVAVSGINSVFSFGVEMPNSENTTGKIKIPRLTSPFFDYTNAAQLLTDKESLFQIYHGEQRIFNVDQAKVNAYYQSYTQRKAVSSYSFKEELGPQIPTGKFRNVEKFYSLQELFPSLYGLQTTRNLDGLSKERRGQIKQLKAYVMLFEQIIADHQSQLAHLGELLSFNSGVKVAKPLCNTYYAQGLYDSPGAELILKAFDVYKNRNSYLDQYPSTNWNEFKADPFNLYEDRLAKSKASEKVNIRRKNQMLSHVLARYGQQYNLESLLELNPRYGNYKLARVENISALLKNFALYGGNLSRSYFLPEHLKKRKRTSKLKAIRTDLFSGLEYKMGLLFQLNNYYKGIIDVVSRGLAENDPNLQTDEFFGPAPNTTPEEPLSIRFLQVSYYDEEILKLPNPTNESPETLIASYLTALRKWVHETKGFVLIDNSLIVDNLQAEQWQILRNSQPVLLRRKGSKQSPQSVNLRQAQRVVEQYANDWSNDSLELNCHWQANENTESVSSGQSLFNGHVSLFLPKWVCRVAQPDFLQTFLTQIAKEGPLQLVYNLSLIDQPAMNELLGLKKTWLGGNYEIQQGKNMSEEAIEATRLLAQFILHQPIHLTQ
jgi:hypothetical protein